MRGTGIYPQASMINHDCLPNLARFDAFDSGEVPPSAGLPSTRLQLRALHDIPAGEELTLSYFPLFWPWEERQQACQQQYGFTCTCLRCQVCYPL